MRATKEVLAAFMDDFNAHTVENRFVTEQRNLSKEGCFDATILCRARRRGKNGQMGALCV
jgi:hypothetical protein